MYEARINFHDDRQHTVEAGSIEMLKMKCAKYIESDLVYEIYVVKVEDIGLLKSNFDVKLL